MTRTGRPLRFLALVLGGWTVMRIGAWSLPADVGTSAHEPVLDTRTVAVLGAQAITIPFQDNANAAADMASGSRSPEPVAGVTRSSFDRTATATGPALATQYGTQDAAGFGNGDPHRPPSQRPAEALITPVARWPATPPSVRSRWSLSGWLLWRPDAAPTLAAAPLLGGSQAGLRVDYRLGRAASLYGRISRAFARPYAEEAALGIALRPVAGVPIALLAERRIRLGEGGRSDFALMAAGGIGPVDLVPRVELEGYAQGGVVGLHDGDGFADGRLSLNYRVSGKGVKPVLALGLATWGSVQPGAERLDVGPELRLRLPLAGGNLRLSAEWRERVAGDARPRSGPAVTLIADF